VIKAVFSASLLQSSVSHDPSEITLIWYSVIISYCWCAFVRNTYYVQCWKLFFGNWCILL